MRNGPNELRNTDHLRYARLWICLGVILMALVVVLSTINPPQSVQFFLLQDKLVHAFVYALLMGWFAQVYRHPLARLALVAVFILMGIGVEFLQALVPWRRFDLLDMLANTSGVLIAWALAHTWMGKILVWLERTFLTRISYSS